MIAYNENEQQPPDSVGGSGGPCVRPRGRADTKLLERALREKWPIPAKYRKPIVQRQVGIAIDPESSPREATSAARCLASMSSENAAIALKLLDKVVPDQHQHEHLIETRHGVAQLLSEASYVEYLRHRTSDEDCDAGAVCQIREHGGGAAVENGTPHGGPGPGANGDRNGSE